uniref:Uncharacterized protein n=1 Tax=Cannabis sativa TaxID=3483 RepID=A0A803QBV0_CANSA
MLLLGKDTKKVSDLELDIIDSGRLNEYTWGKESYYLFLDSVRNAISKNLVKINKVDNGERIGFYRLRGLAYVFQVWFNECWPYIDGIHCSKLHDRIPRILNWCNDTAPFIKQFKNSIFGVSLSKLKVKNLFPTEEELLRLHLDGFFVDKNLDGMGKGKSVQIDDDSHDVEEYDNEEDAKIEEASHGDEDDVKDDDEDDGENEEGETDEGVNEEGDNEQDENE